MRLYLVVSGTGEEREIADVPSIQEASKAVEAMARRFGEWEAAGFPALDNPLDPLGGYEDCTIYLQHVIGDVLINTGYKSWEYAHTNVAAPAAPAPTGLTYVAKSLEDIAQLFDNQALSEAATRGQGGYNLKTKKLQAESKARESTWRAAAVILRRARLEAGDALPADVRD